MADDTQNDNSDKNAPSPEKAPNTTSNDAVAKADAAVVKAENDAALAKLSPEDRKVMDARQKADDARAKVAAEQAEAAALPDGMTVKEAELLVPRHEDMSAGDHFAQKFGNYPENPPPAKADHSDPELCTEKLSMVVPDHPLGARTTMVHPEQVGDYLRAGWARAL